MDHLMGTTKRAEEKAQKIDWKVFGIEKEQVLKLIRICCLSHDFAKATREFQDYISNPNKGVHVPHAPLSALVTYRILRKTGFDVKHSAFGYFVVRHHHGELPNFGFTTENREKIERQFTSIPSDFKRWFENSVLASIDFSVENLLTEMEKQIDSLCVFTDFSFKDYLLLQTLFSILISSDREDAALKDLSIIVNRKLTVETLEKYVSTLPSTGLIQNMRKKFNDHIKQSLQCIDSKILSITAPTGIGKTLANLRVALSLADENTLIVYALPFINIIDQTVDTIYRLLSDVEFDATTVLPYHHLADPSYEDPLYEQQSIQSVLIEGWYSQIVVTTFVSLFESLFTNKKVPFFYKLLNSVLILDEIQSIPHKYWQPLSRLFEEMAKFNCRIILSTATQPMIFERTRELVTERFDLNRTRLHLHHEVPFSDFKCIVEDQAKRCLNNGKKLLVVLNTIREAREVFETLRSKISEKKLCYLSSNVIPKHRLERIRRIKQTNSAMVCVSTQVIEAGVDVSFDMVIRDEAPFDSILQVAGRCNRNYTSSLSDVHVYRVIEDERKRSFSSYIYENLLLDITRDLLKQNHIEEKDFPELSKKYFANIKKRANLDKENLLQLIESLKLEEIGSSFRLIDKKYATASLFIEYDKKAINLRETLNKVLRDPKVEKFEKISSIAKLLRQMAMYTIEVPLLREKLEGAFIIENGLIVIPRDNLQYWYDEDIGFKRSEEVMIF
ncbi:MAG: CRISPR-associated helicase Cas3' [Pseudothermotoga sp.]|nr:CRISPR-associated helicase Cas3' [Pseudothermotoga sp.]